MRLISGAQISWNNKINENQKFRKVVPNTTDAMSGVEKPICKFVAKSKFKRKKNLQNFTVSVHVNTDVLTGDSLGNFSWDD